MSQVSGGVRAAGGLQVPVDAARLRYTYAADSPVTNSDPTGRMIFMEAGGHGGGYVPPPHNPPVRCSDCGLTPPSVGKPGISFGPVVVHENESLVVTAKFTESAGYDTGSPFGISSGSDGMPESASISLRHGVTVNTPMPALNDENPLENLGVEITLIHGSKEIDGVKVSYTIKLSGNAAGQVTYSYVWGTEYDGFTATNTLEITTSRKQRDPDENVDDSAEGDDISSNDQHENGTKTFLPVPIKPGVNLPGTGSRRRR